MNKTLGARIAELRKEKGLTQEQLRKIRKSLRKMRKIHGHLCLFDLDDGAGKELGEKVQIYL